MHFSDTLAASRVGGCWIFGHMPPCARRPMLLTPSSTYPLTYQHWPCIAVALHMQSPAPLVLCRPTRSVRMETSPSGRAAGSSECIEISRRPDGLQEGGRLTARLFVHVTARLFMQGCGQTARGGSDRGQRSTITVTVTVTWFRNCLNTPYYIGWYWYKVHPAGGHLVDHAPSDPPPFDRGDRPAST
jgi:hypothetical protein